MLKILEYQMYLVRLPSKIRAISKRETVFYNSCKLLDRLSRISGQDREKRDNPYWQRTFPSPITVLSANLFLATDFS